jgi:putative transposase
MTSGMKNTTGSSGFVANVLFQSFSYCSLNSETEGSVFKGRHFDHSIILLCVRWYLAYNLSLRNLEEMMAERGIAVDHATIHRWVIRYSPELLERFNRCKRALSCNRCIKEWRSF